MFTESMANWLIEHFGTIPYLVLAFAAGVLGPLLFVWAFARVIVNGRHGVRDGILLGAGVSIWASLCWFLLPYVGAYPCLPGMLVATAVSGTPPVDTLTEELTVHAVSFLLWPTTGGMLFWLKGFVHQPKPDGAADLPHD